jgi:hypothetical protein
MIDLVAGQKIGKSLLWLLTLGESDTKQVRQEIEDLLVHTTATLKSLVELSDALNSLDQGSFNDKSFGPVFMHCAFNYTSPEAVVKARTRCTDIQRDISRILFRLAKILRTDLGKWSEVDDGFGELMNADLTFLERFESDMRQLNEGLEDVLKTIPQDRAAAWKKFESLRESLLEGMRQLRSEIETMKKADKHIRILLS